MTRVGNDEKAKASVSSPLKGQRKHDSEAVTAAASSGGLSSSGSHRSQQFFTPASSLSEFEPLDDTGTGDPEAAAATDGGGAASASASSPPAPLPLSPPRGGDRRRGAGGGVVGLREGGDGGPMGGSATSGGGGSTKKHRAVGGGGGRKVDVGGLKSSDGGVGGGGVGDGGGKGIAASSSGGGGSSSPPPPPPPSTITSSGKQGQHKKHGRKHSSSATHGSLASAAAAAVASTKQQQQQQRPPPPPYLSRTPVSTAHHRRVNTSSGGPVLLSSVVSAPHHVRTVTGVASAAAAAASAGGGGSSGGAASSSATGAISGSSSEDEPDAGEGHDEAGEAAFEDSAPPSPPPPEDDDEAVPASSSSPKKVAVGDHPAVVPPEDGGATGAVTAAAAAAAASATPIDVQEGTPAHRALQENAAVRVTKMEKLGRRLQIPQITKVVKKGVTLRGPNSTRRGKPPRIPNLSSVLGGGIAGTLSDRLSFNIFECEDEGEDAVEQDVGVGDGAGGDDGRVVQGSDLEGIVEEGFEVELRDEDEVGQSDEAAGVATSSSLDAVPPAGAAVAASASTSEAEPPPRHEKERREPEQQQRHARFAPDVPVDDDEGPGPPPHPVAEPAPQHRRVRTEGFGGAVGGVGGVGGSATNLQSSPRQSSLRGDRRFRRNSDSKLVVSGSVTEAAGAGAGILYKKSKEKPHPDDPASRLLKASHPHHPGKWKSKRRLRKQGHKADRRKSYVKGKVIDGEHELYTLSIAVMLGLRTSIGMTNGLICTTVQSPGTGSEYDVEKEREEGADGSGGDASSGVAAIGEGIAHCIGGENKTYANAEKNPKHVADVATESSRLGHRWLDSDDFMAVEKYVFRPKGGPNTPPHQLSHTFKFKDYSPLAFAYLRRLFGINEYEFISSVCGNANFIEFISNAKSGQFFFYSSDGKYMIKTMTNAESKFLRRILPHYFRHCSQYPNTLITKFLGMYRVKLYHLRRNVKFVIMNSVYDTHKFLSRFYDVKGSTIGRKAKPGEDVKKDNDIRASLPENGFVMDPVVRERLRTQILADCNFFKQMKIMDYSMLIGVHRIPQHKARGYEERDALKSLLPSKYDAESIRSLFDERTMKHKHRLTQSNYNELASPEITKKASDFFHDSIDHSDLGSSLLSKAAAAGGEGTVDSPPSTQEKLPTSAGEVEMTPLTLDETVRSSNRSPLSASEVKAAQRSTTTNDDTSVIKEISSTAGEVESKPPRTSVATVGTSANSSTVTPKTSLVSSGDAAAEDLAATRSPPKERRVTNKHDSTAVAPRHQGAESVEDVVSLGTYYEEDDEYSYLDGSLAPRHFRNNSISPHSSLTNSKMPSSIMTTTIFPCASDDSGMHLNLTDSIDVGDDWIAAAADGPSRQRKQYKIELSKEMTTEQMYWPFHRFYNIQGFRRLEPLHIPGSTVDSSECRPDRNGGNASDVVNGAATIAVDIGGCGLECTAAVGTACAEGSPPTEVKGALPAFEGPISNRKDGGLMMDVNKYKETLGLPQAKHVEGKIFYMGIIDVLQQFNIRKRFEAKLRRIQGGGWADASCVHPNLYADRFVEFFDEYTLRNYTPKVEHEEQIGADDEAGVEEIVFEKNEVAGDETLGTTRLTTL